MNRLVSIITHPAFFAIIPSVILFWFLPLNLSLNLLSLERYSLLNDNEYVIYEDITKSGSSERIYLRDRGETTMVVIYSSEGIVYDQWNLYGGLSFLRKRCMFISGDYNDNGNNELFFFTLSNDSVFLHAIERLDDPKLMINSRFIVKAGPGLVNPDPYIISAEMDDLNSDGQKELIFGVSSGFSKYPRNVFAYYIENDSLIMSPESHYQITGIQQTDISGDGKKEVVLRGHASANVNPEDAKYHDFSNWVMVLDNNLDFLFDPIEIPGRTNYMFASFFKDNNDKTKIIAVPDNFRGVGESAVNVFDVKGNLFNKIKLDYVVHRANIIVNKQNENILIVSAFNKGMYFYDSGFNLIKHHPGIQASIVMQADLSNNGNNEIIVIDSFLKEMHVLSHDLNRMASYSLDWINANNIGINSIKKIKAQTPELSIQLGREHFMFSYNENPNLILNYLAFFPLYFGMLGFAMLAGRIKKNQINNKRAVEKKITELQLKLVENQISPHFSMNAISAVIQSIRKNHNEQAVSDLVNYAQLYRSLLLSSDTIQRSIEDEIQFCSQYLELEQQSFDKGFDLNINIAKDVDVSKNIPKMAIHVFAENAVKHGLANKITKGTLNIDVIKANSRIDIIITDDGIGRANASVYNKDSTGKGIEMMEQYFKLYNEYFHQNFDFRIIDLYDDIGNAAGTRVVISKCWENKHR